jgi:hypothetical protein
LFLKLGSHYQLVSLELRITGGKVQRKISRNVIWQKVYIFSLLMCATLATGKPLKSVAEAKV